MSSDNDDVDKLLGQIKLQDFPYRAFGRGEPAPLRVVRSGADGIAPPTASAAAAKAQLAAAPIPPPVDTVAAIPAASAELVRAAVQPSARVGEAFERLARVNASAGAPRVSLQLNLPKRPPFIMTNAAGSGSERRLQDVFECLHRAAAPAVAHPNTAVAQ
ncbi:MAG: hypothetical protein JWR16_2314 [Nevskia sp.]|nr:hypothetical protein [Nevskia sp.]